MQGFFLNLNEFHVNEGDAKNLKLGIVKFEI